MALALSVTPIRPSIRQNVRTYDTPNDVCPLSQIVLIRSFWNLVTLLSTIMCSSSSMMVHVPPCLQELSPNVRSLSQILLISILWNLVTLFSTLMSSSSIMVHIAAHCLQELWPFVNKNLPFKSDVCSVIWIVWSEFYETWSHCLVPWCLQVR